MPSETCCAILYDAASGSWRRFSAPHEVICARSLEEVLPALEQVERMVEIEGLHAVGFVSYEAAPAFDPALTTFTPGDFPLLWFGLFNDFEATPLAQPDGSLSLEWCPALDEASFTPTIDEIKQAIARGETYQVNYTFPLTSRFKDEPLALFRQLVQGEPTAEAAYIDTGRFSICSASPELFFELNGERLISRPMKGTAARGMTLPEDQRQAEALYESTKDRAENVMILDMIRNDLGRLPGGPVEVLDEFKVEKYPTVWQMTSTAATTTKSSVSEIFGALFPCASITGAPKVQTMRIIHALEQRPRRIYTGAIGQISPGRKARFSVAIRTALIDREEESAEYGVGAGITWGSEPQAEYRECLLKSRILSSCRPSFELLETILWTPEEGYALLPEHIQRISASAEYFDYPCPVDEISAHLDELTISFPQSPHKVRLMLDRQGAFRTEASEINLPDSLPPLRLALAKEPVDRNDPFLYHKTTHRALYTNALEDHPEADEVLLWNEDGELTEACVYNLVLEKDGEFLTPTASSGLLPGTQRVHLLAKGILKEAVLHREDLESCDRIWLVNSVRGWREAVLSS